MSATTTINKAAHVVEEGIHHAPKPHAVANVVKNTTQFQWYNPLHLMDSAGSFLNNITNHLFPLSIVGGIAGWVGSKTPEIIGKPLAKIGEVAGVQNATLGELGVETEKVIGNMPVVGKAISGGADKISQFAKNILPDHIHQKSTSSLLYSSAFALGGTARLANGIGHRLETLMQVEEDLTGKRPSTLKILFDRKNLHPLTQEVTQELFGLGSLVSTLSQLASIAFSVFSIMAKKELGGKAGFAVQLGLFGGLPMLESTFNAKNTALDAYREAHIYAAKGQEVPVETYTRLFSGLNPDMSEEMATNAANECIAKKFTPEEVLRAFSTQRFPDAPIGAATARLAEQQKQKSQLVGAAK